MTAASAFETTVRAVSQTTHHMREALCNWCPKQLLFIASFQRAKFESYKSGHTMGESFTKGLVKFYKFFLYCVLLVFSVCKSIEREQRECPRVLIWDMKSSSGPV